MSKDIDLILALTELEAQSPLSPKDRLLNPGLFLTRRTLSRILFAHEMYKRIVDVPGCVLEFGVRWGQNLALFELMRRIYEPFNFTRKIIGFDTFEGFASVHEKDGGSERVHEGNYKVSEDYADYLEQLLACHQAEGPAIREKTTELVRGDATQTIPAFFEDNPGMVVALAYFDFDIYAPTKVGLEQVRKHLVRGSVVGFDELNCRDFPGETIALREALGLDRFRPIRTPFAPYASFFVVDAPLG